MVTMGILTYQGKNPHGRSGNLTRNLMISSQKRWLLDHAAGLKHEWNDTEMGNTEVLWQKPVPVPFCPLQIPHSLVWSRTRASAVRGRGFGTTVRTFLLPPLLQLSSSVTRIHFRVYSVIVPSTARNFTSVPYLSWHSRNVHNNINETTIDYIFLCTLDALELDMLVVMFSVFGNFTERYLRLGTVVFFSWGHAGVRSPLNILWI
jgi:hypothetical protein